MKIAQRETAIDCYYTRVQPTLAATQNSRVMAVVQPDRDYSLSELMALTNTRRNRQLGSPDIDKSSMSRCINGLRAAGRLEAAPERKCTVTGVTVTPSRLPARQISLF